MKNFIYLTIFICALNSLKFLASDLTSNKKESNKQTPVILSFIELSQEDSIFIETDTLNSNSQNSSTSQSILSFTEFKKEEDFHKEEFNPESITTLSAEEEKVLPQIKRDITLYEPLTSSSQKRSLGIVAILDNK